MIKAILFDLDDTLLWDEKSVKKAMMTTCEFASGKYNVNPVELERKVRENARASYASLDTYAFTQMIGISPFEGLWGDFLDEGVNFRALKEIVPSYRKDVWAKGLQDMGIDDPNLGYELAALFPELRKGKQYIYEDTFKVLDQLKGKYKLLMLTNGSPDLQHTKLRITPTLAPYFDQIVISGDFGKGKPAPTIFEYALELLEVNKDEALMVGDNLMTDILGASRTGIQSVWINHHQKRQNEIKPTYEVSTLEDLLPIVGKLNR